MDGESWPDWSGRTAACIATGPSLTAKQIQFIRDADIATIAINDAGLECRLPVAAPWADILYAADIAWWQFYRPAFRGLRVCGTSEKGGGTAISLGLADLTVLCETGAPTYKPGFAAHGGHSGYQALQIAISLGAVRVILIGYDCKPSGNQTNYFGNKPKEIFKESPYAEWVRGFAGLKIPQGVEVINCTPGSAISCFRRAQLVEVL